MPSSKRRDGAVSQRGAQDRAVKIPIWILDRAHRRLQIRLILIVAFALWFADFYGSDVLSRISENFTAQFRLEAERQIVT